MFEATTILGFRGEYNGKQCAIIGGDGQVTFGNCVLKGNATKIRTLYNGQILSGFAGSTADAFSLFDTFERILEGRKGDLVRSVMEFAKQWRSDKYLRKLEAMMIVLNKEHIFILSGSGDVVEPEDGQIAAIGSGGNYALSAARALNAHSNLAPKELVEQSLRIAGEICIYTNTQIKILEL
ncbi:MULTISPECIES: ATP-dependent protease subunit HslV [Helicobacter]|uniref:ATP-dependent protease subunit HslV n=1 Tax=Helicobacter typhlonius TaxID=76936 RepID=A0A099UE83_9HELI|nr:MULTISPECIES: ATP-dependent protease subunit HslV [Helicobacter]TLD79037.1 ATP-dependent protease subunit HslV [Helicobacter typhlonius]TLD89879.1 ATP-dependent protease subunit HslV [Helicobacter sp. MIT 03-1616]CUU40329.1 ATP-dependent protease HslV [Helicobacter typhlonius]